MPSESPTVRRRDKVDSAPVGYVFVLVAATLWGLLGSFSKLAFQEGITPLEVAFWRAAIGSVLFGAHALVLRQARVAPRDLPAVLGFGVLGISVFYAAYQFAVRTGGAALAAVLLYTAPALVALLAWLLLRERMTPGKLGALALTLLGVAAISLQGGEVRLSAAALSWGLLSAFTYALYYIFGKLYLNRYATATVFLYALPVGALGLFPLVEFHGKSLLAWAAVVFIALLATYGANLAYYAGLRRLEATRAAVVATFEPVVAAAVAFAWWGERFGPLGYAGSALVLLGLLILTLEGRGRRG